MYLGLLAGIALLIVQRRADLLIPIGAIAIYLVLVSSGPPAYSRFRAPVMPFFAVVAGYGYAHRADVRTASIGFFVDEDPAGGAEATAAWSRDLCLQPRP